MSNFKLALAQFVVTSCKSDNLRRAAQYIREAASNGADLVVLPEMFNCPYGNEYFPKYAEKENGTTVEFLSKVSKDNNVWVIGGSIPEERDSKIFNTSYSFNKDGDLVGKYSKVHLFDIDIPNKITFKESDTLTAGSSLCVVESPWCKIGVGICYDMRFPDLAKAYAKQECQLLIYPGAFNMTTGPLHWELLQRARAVDHQLYVAAVSPARSSDATYTAWGHSTIVGPYGQVISACVEEETIVYGDIDLNFVKEVRQNIPIRKQGRPEVYSM